MSEVMVTVTEKSFVTIFSFKKAMTYFKHFAPGADPGFDQGGAPDRDRPKLPMVSSSVMRVKRALFSVGSGAHLRALEALGYFITKYAFSPFWGTFLYYFGNNKILTFLDKLP